MSIISFDVHVDDLEAVLAVYDRVQVWRSPDSSGSPTPYEEITAETALPAILEGSLVGPWNLQGTALGISLSGAETITVPFTGANPWNLQQVLDKINAAIPELASERPPETNEVRLTSPVSGTAASVGVSGAAVSILGFASKANGKSARLVLNRPSISYSFRDFDGSLSYWYKTRFYSSQTKAASSFSLPRQGAPQNVLGIGFTVKAIAHLADGAGNPIIGRRVIFVPLSVTTVDIGSGTFYSSLPGIDRLVATTDDSGRVEMRLMIGATYRVFFEGTGYQREFVVPEADFDLLSVLSSVPDIFSIKKTPAMPIRVS